MMNPPKPARSPLGELQGLLRFIGIVLIIQAAATFALFFIGAYAASQNTHARMNDTYETPIWESLIHMGIAVLTAPAAALGKILPSIDLPFSIGLLVNAYLTGSLLLALCLLLKKITARR